jgi:hypothetical protein
MADESAKRDADQATRYIDPVIEAYKRDVDRTMIRENLRRTVQQRIDAMIDHLHTIEELHRAGEAQREAGERAA